MIILTENTKLEKAVAKAKKVRPQVKFIAFGKYSVKGSSGFYTVVCQRDAHGNKTVSCDCKGGEKGLVCYHSVSALAVHVGLAKMRQ
jgi:hypothetical protein